MKQHITFVLTVILALSAGTAAFSQTKGDAAKGKQVYDTRCAMCHGPGGKGDGPAAAALQPKPRDLSDAQYMSGLTNDYIFKIISKGGAAVGKSAAMPAHSGMLSDQDIWDVVSHISENLCKCKPK